MLALCTFLVPLGALAWLQQNELRSRDQQVRGALQREASLFLVGAAQEIEHQFDRLLPALAQQAAEQLLREAPDREPQPTTLTPTTCDLRQEQPALRSILLLDPRGVLRAPEPGIGRNAPPLARDVESREMFNRGDGQSEKALRCAELLLEFGEWAAAEDLLREGLNRLPPASGRFRRGFGESAEVELRLQFRLGSVLLKQGKRDEGLLWLQRVRDQVETMREFGRRGFDADVPELGLLAETLLAEHEAGLEARMQLLTALAGGLRDNAAPITLRMVGERLAAAIAPDSPLHSAAAELVADLDVHLDARSFASDYESYLDESVRLLLHNRAENAPGSSRDSYKVFSLDGDSSVLFLHPLTLSTGANGGWLGLQFDLDRLLASCLGSYIRGNGRFVLAVTDTDGQSIVDGPATPASFAPPSMLSHSMQLLAYPADVDDWLQEAKAAANSAALMVLALFLVAAVGAGLLWRSVSRESELATMKVELVSRVSHELKTPLALISLYGETLGLKRARDADQAADFGRIITREAGRLTTLIQRILDFSRQQAGTAHYQPEACELGPLLRETAEAYLPHLEAKGFRLQCDLQPDVHAQVDAKALAGALVNLLDNAVKYAAEDAPAGAIELQLRLDGRSATIDVLDRGRGVPERERDTIFESFYRASNAGEVRGAGLGLSIVRHFAEAHGGTATVLPRDGGGSIFRIQLPASDRLNP